MVPDRRARSEAVLVLQGFERGLDGLFRRDDCRAEITDRPTTETAATDVVRPGFIIEYSRR